MSTRVRAGLPSLRGRKLWAAVRRAFVHGCERGGVFRIVHFSVQGQHVHLLCEAKDRTALSRGMQAFKIRAARAINKALGRQGAVFDERFHQRALETPTECRHALAYVLGNQRHHAYAENASYPRNRVDPCSSARSFDGWTIARPRAWIDWPRTDDMTVPPTTWLLRGGWRRGGGPIDPNVVPGLPRGAPPLLGWNGPRTREQPRRA